MRGRYVLLLAMLAGAAGCDGSGVVGLDHPIVGIGGNGSELSAAVVGNWQHTLFFVDDLGNARSSEITWRFASDGTAIRDVVTRNFTDQVEDLQETTALWTVTGSTMTITFTAPSAGTISLDVAVVGDTLTLAGQPYLRLVE